MAKLTLTDLTTLVNDSSAVTAINANMALIETAMENTLSRDGTSPNTMSANFDMNNNDILNVDNIQTTTMTVGGVSITAQVTAAAASATAAAASATAAASSATSASTSATNASTSATNASTSATSAASSASDVAAATDTFKYLFDSSTTMADPGSGDLRLNNATLANVTAIAFSNTYSGGSDISDWIATWDDSTHTPASRIIIRKSGDADFFAIYNVAAVTDNGAWLQLTVTHSASGGGTLSASDALFISNHASGSDGTMVGPASSTDNAVARWNGTGGTTVQNSGVIIDDSNNITGVATITANKHIATTFELTTGGDTTLERVSAGDFSVEGNLVYRAGGTDVPVTDGGTGASTAAGGFDALKQAATASYTGVVELATTAEVQTGTDTTRVVTPEGFTAGLKSANNPEIIMLACSDETTALTTGTAKVTFRMPFAMTLTSVRGSVTTAATGATLLTVDINESGSTILSTKLTFDASEKTTTTATTAAVISDATLADDAEMTIDIDAVGSTVAGAGLKVALIGYRTP